MLKPQIRRLVDWNHQYFNLSWFPTVQSRIFQCFLHTSTPSNKPPGTCVPLELLCSQLWIKQESISDQTYKHSGICSSNTAVRKFRPSFPQLIWGPLAKHHHPTLSGRRQSIAIEHSHTLSLSLGFRSVSMADRWVPEIHSLAADLWLKEGKSRGQCALNSSV